MINQLESEPSQEAIDLQLRKIGIKMARKERLLNYFRSFFEEIENKDLQVTRLNVSPRIFALMCEDLSDEWMFKMNKDAEEINDGFLGFLWGAKVYVAWKDEIDFVEALPEEHYRKELEKKKENEI